VLILNSTSWSLVCALMIYGLFLYNDICHACMHGLIHDGRLQAWCLLRLMYVFRLLYTISCFRVMACLGFQLVDSCIKGQAPPSLVNFFLNSFVRESFFHSQIGFLDAHGSYCMATVYIHYVFFPSFQFNFWKTIICHLMLKAIDFS